MAAVNCPHCDAPMTQAEYAGGTCPLCGQSLQVIAPNAEDAAPEVTANPMPLIDRVARKRKRSGAIWLMAALLVAINGGVWYTFFISKPKPSPQSQQAVNPAPLTKPDSAALNNAGDSTPPVTTADAGQNDAVKTDGSLPVAGNNEHPAARIARADGLDVPILPRLPRPVAPDPQANEPGFQEIEGEDVVLFRPNESFKIRAIDGGRHIKLRGKVKVLRIHSINGKSTLDASELEVEQIAITGNIDGGSIVKLHAPAGKITIRGIINGQSKVEIIAPDGSVTFDSYKARPETVAFINGESLLQITAKNVKLAGAIEGTKTRVQVTLNRDGSLNCGNIGGQSQLIYRKDKATDPDPNIFTGQVSSAAKLQRVE